MTALLRSSFAAFTLLAATVTAPAWARCHEAADTNTTRTLPAQSKRLSVISPVTIVLRQGPTASLAFSGAAEDVARVDVFIEKDLVVLRNKGLFGHGPQHPVTVVVTLPAVEELRVAGRAQLRTEGQLTGAALAVTVEGGAAVELSAAISGQLTTALSGPATLTVSGQCTRYAADLSGSGHIDATRLAVADATASVMGEGDIQLTATTTLAARVIGLGRIRYAGPAAVTEHVGGGGAVVNLNTLANKPQPGQPLSLRQL